MRRLGLHTVYTPSSAPCVVVLIYDAETNEPLVAWVQESVSDVARIKINNVYVECDSVIDTINVNSTRPQSGGSLVRNTATINFRTNQADASPLIDSPFDEKFYSGGRNFDNVYFAIYSIDRSNLLEDIRLGACYGIYKLDNEVSWGEKDGVQTIALIDILLEQDDICAAIESEPVPDFFFYYNSWYNANFMLKAYGQVPRIKVLNAFPSFSIKDFTASITGKVRSAYTNVSTTIILEDNVDDASLLLQAVALGGTVRIKMHDGEVIAGTLSYDNILQTITLNVVTRNTYYNQILSYNDSMDGRSPDQWGPNPNWTDTQFSTFHTVVPNAKDVILDQNGFMQANIWFYRVGEIQRGIEVPNVVCQIQGLLEERKDVVIHTFWPDPLYPLFMSQGSISGYYTNVDNATYLPPDHFPLWPIAAFQVLKFFAVLKPIRFFFNNPNTSVAGSGAVGSPWSMVNIEATVVDTSCYIRNGYSLFSVDHVFCEGEGKLIRIPPANITITQSATFYGLTNMCKIALTAAPLDMNIGAKSNIVYVDCLYKTGANNARAEKILHQIILQEAPHLIQFAGLNITGAAPGYVDNFLPYVGWVCNEETKITDIIDRLCYQVGITLRWDYGLFDISVTGRVFNNVEIVEAGIVDYVRPLCDSTDEDEMLDASAEISIGKLKTAKYVDGGKEEYVALYFKATYGGWEDPYYPAIRSSSNRNIKPNQRLVTYHFDLINDQSSFNFAVASALSTGHPSGYGLAQRKAETEMSLNGCRWEAMDPIVFKRFPGISAGVGTITYDAFGNLIFPQRADAKPYIVAAFCSVETVEYQFEVIKPVVKLSARACQPFVQASGISVYKPPGIPDLPDMPSEDPNTPPNTNTGNNGGQWTMAGNSLVMPLVFDGPSSLEINSLDIEESDFTLTVDSGFIYDNGFIYSAYIQDLHSPTGVADLANYGAELTGNTSGLFPDKINAIYIPLVYTLTLRVNYRWLFRESLGTTSRPLTIVVSRTYQIGRSPGAPYETDFVTKEVTITRRSLPNVEGS